MRALILAAEGVEDLEIYYPLYRLQEAGVEVDVATPGGSSVTAKHGYTVDADKPLSAVKSDAYDLLIIPGGKAPETVRLDVNAVEVTQEMFKAGKIVGAVCHGAQVLVSAGVLSDRKVTCWKGVRDDVKLAGATFFDQEVVVDGNLITSRCPSDLPAFCREIFRALKK